MADMIHKIDLLDVDLKTGNMENYWLPQLKNLIRPETFHEQIKSCVESGLLETIFVEIDTAATAAAPY